MAPSREIEKLQRRWQENPLGLTFAPLAEAYRKEGMFPDALELLNIGLVQHPNYVPAHIVRGRCFLDTRADKAAEAAFQRALELDPENVIALRSLADVAERGGRFDEARVLLERLLEFDRSNEGAREQLARVAAGARVPNPGKLDMPVAEVPEPAPEPEPPEGVEPMPAEVEPELPPDDRVTEVIAVAASEVSLASFDVDVVEVDPAGTATETADETVSEDEAAEPVRPAATQAPADGEDKAAVEGPSAAIVDEDAEGLDVALFHPIELSPEQSSEYQQPDDAATLRPDQARGDDLEPGPDGEDAVADFSAFTGHDAEDLEPASPEPVEEELPVEPTAAAAAPAADPVEDAITLPVDVDEGTPDDGNVGDRLDAETDALLAEVANSRAEMAEEDAELDDPETAGESELVITETMAELFLNQGHRELALAVYTQLQSRDPDNPRLRAAIEELRPAGSAPPSVGLPPFAAVLTGGQSVRGYFEQLLSATRPAPAAADDGLSLGAVFEESAAATAPSEAQADAGPSYDEFFAGDPAGVPDPLPPTGEEEDAIAEDLESFTTWLKGLKR